MNTLVECVPNFSEGRDAAKVDAIVAAISSVPGATILDREMDADHNRSVITFVAPREAVVEAAFQGVKKAVELIDLNKHQGAHPRLGAADVIPFVPLEGVTLDDCVALAQTAAARIWKELHVPVYLYEAAAQRLERKNLENIRRGQFEGVREEIATNPERLPDFGEARLHDTAGACVVGARKFLIAYNVNLDTADVSIAKQIAKKVRASSGGLPCVKGMGVELKARNLAQVSMNLTDFETTPVAVAFEAVKKEAAALGVGIAGSEIIGLIPKRALEDVAASYLKVEGFSPSMIVENRLAAALAGVERPAEMTAKKPALSDFLEAVAAPTATPGGGSVAAAAGALAAALGRMVASMSRTKKTLVQYESRFAKILTALEADCAALTAAVDRDAQSYNAVAAAYKLPKDSPGRPAAVQAALKLAAEVPLETAERATRVEAALAILEEIGAPSMASDVAVGRMMAEAAIGGALANVETNLGSITDKEFVAATRSRMEEMTS
jgi:glutamate formiminotransferase / formiminotetrahydrofolate cyclodeaminase